MSATRARAMHNELEVVKVSRPTALVIYGDRTWTASICGRGGPVVCGQPAAAAAPGARSGVCSRTDHIPPAVQL